jgi:hypothetical protein
MLKLMPGLLVSILIAYSVQAETVQTKLKPIVLNVDSLP